MTRNDHFRQFPGNGKDSTRSQATPLNQELNRPVPVDEFDRQRMGIAAKE